MVYEVKSQILGFEQMVRAELEPLDEMFATLRDPDHAFTAFTLVSPYSLREYSFEIPYAIKALLEIDENAKLLVYNVVVVQDPLDMSCVNFLAPLIFNEDNHTMAQVVLKVSEYPDFSIAQTIQSFRP